MTPEQTQYLAGALLSLPLWVALGFWCRWLWLDIQRTRRPAVRESITWCAAFALALVVALVALSHAVPPVEHPVPNESEVVR